jgi:hypothetical protein
MFKVGDDLRQDQLIIQVIVNLKMLFLKILNFFIVLF